MSFFTNGKSSSSVTSKFNTERSGVYGNIGEIQAVEYQFSEADTLMPDIRVKLTVFVDGLQYPKIIEIASWFSKDNGELSGPGSTFKINRLFEGVGVNLKAEAEGKDIVTIEDYVDFYSSMTNRLLDQKVVWISYVNREWEGKLKYAAHSFVSTFLLTLRKNKSLALSLLCLLTSTAHTSRVVCKDVTRIAQTYLPAMVMAHLLRRSQLMKFQMICLSR